ncbi:hypothetical protein LP421_19485 [Rhizobium sp. RCAM05350]|nr:hypothetical protein LP421_19485 [Rhizobium sp. RCAM05350]
MARLNIGASQMEGGGSADHRTVTEELPQRTCAGIAQVRKLAPLLQSLMGYPVVTAGIVMGSAQARRSQPGTMYDITGWTPNVSQWTIASYVTPVNHAFRAAR